MESGGSRGVALVTGASSGIGAAFGRQLAARGYDLVLVARREARLAELAANLRAAHGVEAEVLPADLSATADVERVEQRIRQLDRLELLVNDAGFDTMDRFAASDLDRQLDMIGVHVIAGVRLMRAALPGMIARRRGDIVNVASIAALVPFTSHPTYAATKAFLVTFSQALQGELVGTGVRVQALCPGFTYTELHDAPDFVAAGFRRSDLPRFLWSSGDSVVAASLAALGRGPVVVVPGWQNRLIWLAGGNRFTSRLARRARSLLRRGRHPVR